MTATPLLDAVLNVAQPRFYGRVARVVGLNLDVEGLQLPIGSAVTVESAGGPLLAEVVAIREDGLVCMPLGELRGIRAGAPVEATAPATTVPVGPELLGRVLDGLGAPIDGGPSLRHLPR